MPSAASLERRAQRQSTLKMLELEQQAQDAVDVLMTEDQRKTLIESFQTVKTVFTDLDSFHIEDDEPTPRVSEIPKIPSSPPVCSSASISDSEPENMPAFPASIPSGTIRPSTAQLVQRTLRRTASDAVLATTPPLNLSSNSPQATPSMACAPPLDEADKTVKENIDKAAARWKQRATRSPLRGLFDRASVQNASAERNPSPVAAHTGRKRSRSEDPCSGYAHRQREDGVMGLGMSFGMASDLCSSPSPSRSGPPSSPPPLPLKPRSSKRPRLAVKSPPKSEKAEARDPDAMKVDSGADAHTPGDVFLTEHPPRGAADVRQKRKR